MLDTWQVLINNSFADFLQIKNWIVSLIKHMEIPIFFKIIHPTKDLKFILNHANWPLKRIWLAGEQRATPNGILLVGKNKDSYCVFSLSSMGRYISVADAIIEVQIFFQKNKELNYLIKDKNFKKAIYCTLGENDKFMLNIELISILAEMEISLEIDKY